jgi:hypothetical protein
MTALQIALLLGLFVLLLLWWLRRRAAASRDERADPDRIDTLIGWPPQATRVLTRSERLAFALLVQSVPEHHILAQVPLSRFLRVPKRHSYADWLRRLGHQCADFVVCDANFQVLAVVELQAEAGQVTDRIRRRQERMARSMKAAKVPLHLWTEGRLPSAEAVRKAIIPTPPTGSAVPANSLGTTTSAAPVPAPATTLAAATPNAASPFEESGRDSTHDERIELLEPPASTWFDDLDSAPAPLRKP